MPPADENAAPSYEPPDDERPGSASPTETILEYEAQERHDPYAAFRLPQYRWFIGGWLVQLIGHQMLATAVAWEIFDRTNSKLALGLIAGVQVVPLFVLGLPAGQWADRF